MVVIDDRTEWIETDGLGGFASGTTSGIRTRRYHGLLLPATTPPTGRMVLVNGFDAWVETSGGARAITTQRYLPDVLFPDGSTRIAAFTPDPWPAWEFDLGGGASLRQEIVVEHGTGTVVVLWSLAPGGGPVTLRVRPLLSGRDYHSMHHENGAFRFDPEQDEAAMRFRPYDGVPGTVFVTNGGYRHAPEWFRQFLYREERERGLDAAEDLASPGELTWAIDPGRPAVWILKASGREPLEPCSSADAEAMARAILDREAARRSAFVDRLDRSADAYLVRRRSGRTIVAGYPWFTDWGRDTFIAIRGLCLATNRLQEARDILVEWAATVSEGMLPNRFPDSGDAPEFNSVDASLWYVVAVSEFLQRAGGQPALLSGQARQALERAVGGIVAGYAAGTRFGIRMDDDGLLAAGVPGVQLTWMDARVGDRVITPRIGKPVEIQALWLNALAAASDLDPRWQSPLVRGRSSFVEKFWIEERGYFADVVDVDHVAGTRDEQFRPNQILAVGGLPLQLVDGDRAARIVEAVAIRLLTPIGLRSLDRNSPAYASHYDGDPSARDAVYHQGTVWPWLMGPFVEAWVRTQGGTDAARREARRRFLPPLVAHLDAAGVGHVSEITDAEAPFTPRGCPFQAWSLGELLRLDRVVLEDASTKGPRHIVAVPA